MRAPLEADELEGLDTWWAGGQLPVGGADLPAGQPAAPGAAAGDGGLPDVMDVLGRVPGRPAHTRATGVDLPDVTDWGWPG
jgi:hypothetical protein